MSHRDRVSARLIAWGDSPTNHGRRRFRGGKRGQPSWDATQAFDLRIAIAELTGAHEMILRGEHAEMAPMERAENRRAAMAKVRLASRAIDDVIDRPEPRTGIDPPAKRRGR